MIDYADYFSPDLFFVTSAAINRERILNDEPKRRLLRSVLNQVKQHHPFRTLGWVILPDHWHLLLAVTQGSTLDRVVQSVVRQFNQEYLTLLGMPAGGLVWPARYEHHKVVDAAALAVHLDYVHYDPVRHGWAARPEEWLSSSYEEWIERGAYELGWGWSEPTSIRGRDWG